ncbi:MAG: hypothetical protein R2728_05030 [Chitinophagales bacterium]
MAYYNTNDTVTIPTFSGSIYNYRVDWGDTVISGYNGNASHVYADAGIHTIAISGTFPEPIF